MLLKVLKREFDRTQTVLQRNFVLVVFCTYAISLIVLTFHPILNLRTYGRCSQFVVNRVGAIETKSFVVLIS